ncbi:hypothetical protein RclHR1_13730015 [Rhizophagus clarus]|uniref:Uncharacterized protein n=1 Tax=Rhizophagus clarus TaxID=94130 RepID=A0A2Z6QCR8_9GLOM|nr:hypothetical protein RclHR1_13730015 [Rhizophagus clarus]GES83798.1 hypothetical protein RCL_jg9579.t1 [Rhizophagus clarus]
MILEALIRDHQEDITYDFNLHSRINNWDLFKPFNDESHILYPLLHQVITEDLTEFIVIFIRSQKTILLIAIKFCQSLFTHIVLPCWHLRNKEFHDFIKAQRLTIPSINTRHLSKRKRLDSTHAADVTSSRSSHSSRSVFQEHSPILDKGFHRNVNSLLYKFTIPSCYFIKPFYFYSL